MVSYGSERAAIKEEARQIIRELQTQQATEPEAVPDGYYGWDSTPAKAVGDALAELGIHRTAYRTS